MEGLERYRSSKLRYRLSLDGALMVKLFLGVFGRFAGVGVEFSILLLELELFS